MTEDTYTTGDPIFEHGGESEKIFAGGREEYDNEALELMLDSWATIVRQIHAEYATKWAYRYARELERRRLENG